jgi:predicted nucleotidyltransferase
MRRDQTLKILRDAAPALRERYGVVGVRLFGSVARGDDDDVSDLDVAVSFATASPFDVMKLCGVSGFLSGLVGTDVDVVAEPARDPGLKAVIDREAIIAF